MRRINTTLATLAKSFSLLNHTANAYCMLMPLLVLASSARDGGLACSASLITLHLNVDHPTGGFPTVGDGIFSMEELELGSSTLVNPSSQSEELQQQCVSLHLSQNSQYLAKSFLSCSTSPSDSVWLLLLHVWGQWRLVVDTQTLDL